MKTLKALAVRMIDAFLTGYDRTAAAAAERKAR